MSKFKKNLMALAFILGLGIVAVPQTVSAIDVTGDVCDDPTISSQSAICASKDETVDSFFKNLVNTLLYIIGALSVLMIIIGGLRYTISGGSAEAIKSAKNIIMYAIIGLVVALLAYAIVNWVLVQFQ